MFSKNNLKHILIIAIGFFTCSSIYLTQSTILADYSSVDFANKISVLYANLAMAFGIFLFSFIYNKKKNIKQYYILSMMFSLISLITFFETNNVQVMSLFLCLSCLFGTSGFCLGYHFSLIASNIEKEYRGRVFAFGYAIGSILSYLFMILPNKIFTSYISLAIYIPLILINLYLVIKTKPLDVIQKENCTSSFKNYFIVLSIIIVLM